jgi:hypothetical protein
MGPDAQLTPRSKQIKMDYEEKVGKPREIIIDDIFENNTVITREKEGY